MHLCSTAGNARQGKTGFAKVAAALSTLLLASGLVAACGSAGSGGSSPAVYQEEASQTIGPEGGIVMTENGSSISIPAGALTHDVTISITSNPSAPALTDGTPVGMYYLLGPEGQQFNVPVTVTLAYDTALPSGVAAQDLVIFTAPRTSSDYLELDTTVVDSLHVSAPTTHFSNAVPAAPKYTKMFGLGVDAPTAIQSPNYGELDEHWRTGEFSIQSARLVVHIDATDDNPDSQCTSDINSKCCPGGNTAACSDLLQTNALSVSEWAARNAGGLTALTSWLSGVKAGGLTPLVAIQVQRFSHDRGQASLSTGQFRARFGYLLDAFPQVARWGLINEPNGNGFSAGDGGIAQAVEYYVNGAEVLHDLQAKGHSGSVRLWAGEFAWGAPQSYWWDYLGETLKQVDSAPKSDHIGFPHVWGLHPYGDTTSGNTDETGAYTKFLGEFESQHHWQDRSLRVWLTETGTMFEWAAGNCGDAGSKYKTTGAAEKAQFDGARAVYEFTTFSRVDRVYWWQFQQAPCTWGGNWDSGMVDWNGTPRAPFCALTGQSDYRSACSGMAYSRDCGGPGKNNCTSTSTTSPPSSSGGGGGSSTCTSVPNACVKSTGSGSNATCDSNWSTVPGFTCADAPTGYASGSCSTTSLAGCCVTTTVGGGYTTTAATCYYDAAGAAAAETGCTGGTGGVTLAWSSCPP
jgi:hypothetical protein